jgi:hypothetical protein
MTSLIPLVEMFLLAVRTIPLEEFLIESKLREKKYCTPSSLAHQPNQCNVVDPKGSKPRDLVHLNPFLACPRPKMLLTALAATFWEYFLNTFNHFTSQKLVLTHVVNFKEITSQFGACTNLVVFKCTAP